VRDYGGVEQVLIVGIILFIEAFLEFFDFHKFLKVSALVRLVYNVTPLRPFEELLPSSVTVSSRTSAR